MRICQGLCLIVTAFLVGCGSGDSEELNATDSIESQLKAAGAKSGEATTKTGAEKVDPTAPPTVK